MSELETQKFQVVKQLRSLCAHCATNSIIEHHCAVEEIAVRVQLLRGVPLIVNNEFRGALLTHYAQPVN